MWGGSGCFRLGQSRFYSLIPYSFCYYSLWSVHFQSPGSRLWLGS